ncbi:hypothetical protein GJ744_004510 [Endocarpon pusillum]|uniref:Uncharacterized protein n=1 Tax=Endocarpon pusillum TaxID=364733 RepID=A0A8H7ARK8_9EURO|nr:hypothetical protein GJ744_004510 [Endocarpon pusillum]
MVLYIGNQSFAGMKEKGYSYQCWDRRVAESNSSYILPGNGRSDLVWIEMSDHRDLIECAPYWEPGTMEVGLEHLIDDTSIYMAAVT